MTEIKTTTEVFVTNGNETWEDLGKIALYKNNYRKGLATLLYKNVPGLGKRFKIVYCNESYVPQKSLSGSRYNAYISGLECFLDIEGF